MKIGGLSVDLNGAPGSSKQNFVHSKLDALNAASCYEDNYEDDRPESPPPSYESLHVNIWTNKEQVKNVHFILLLHYYKVITSLLVQ